MKKLFVLICSLAIGTAAFAAPAKNTHVVAHMSGTVEKYDAASKTLTVKHDGAKETTFEVTDTSAVMKGKSKADVSSLTTSTGQGVKVAYVMQGSTRVAERIDVSPATHTVAAAKKK